MRHLDRSDFLIIHCSPRLIMNEHGDKQRSISPSLASGVLGDWLRRKTQSFFDVWGRKTPIYGCVEISATFKREYEKHMAMFRQ